jgi:hypothetical protein
MVSPGFYFATHQFGWRSVVEVRQNVVTRVLYVVTLNQISKFPLDAFRDFTPAIEER